MTDIDKPLIWLLDSERTPMARYLEVFDDWADTIHVPQEESPDWDNPPDAIFFSAECKGGAAGEWFASLSRAAGGIPLLAVARLRSLAQAVAFFRAGAIDYLSLPLEEDDARERLAAALERSAQLAMQGVMVELESLDQDPGEISLSLLPTEVPVQDEDILAQLPGNGAVPVSEPEPTTPPLVATAATLSHHADDDVEPVAVDGLPIPSLWEELPCGLLVFDSNGNMVFSNSLGLELFGYESLAELQEALDNRRAEFAAYGANGKPMPDNQWPHVLSAKTRTARSAVISIEKPDKRRVWLRIDCMPHLSEAKISRLSMTLVNLTGELPSLAQPSPSAPTKREKGKQKGKRKK